MNDEPQRERGSTAGAWAAAAVVLALGALIFAVLAHVRITDLEDRVATLEAEASSRSTRAGLSDGFDETIGSTVGDLGAPSGSADPAAAPLDAEQARVDVIAAFTAVYDPAAGIESRVRLIDDATGVAAAIRQAAAGPNGPVIASVAVDVNQVDFVSATRAHVIYGLTVPGQAPILGREGEARVVAGAWKVTRATVCADLEAVGGACG